MSKFLFGDIVVVDEYYIGVIVKICANNNNRYYYKVYVRSYDCIKEYDEDKIERNRVRYKTFI